MRDTPMCVHLAQQGPVRRNCGMEAGAPLVDLASHTRNARKPRDSKAVEVLVFLQSPLQTASRHLRSAQSIFFICWSAHWHCKSS